MIYWPDKGSHGSHAIERCHDHDDDDLRLEERVVKVIEMHVNIIDGDRQG